MNAVNRLKLVYPWVSEGCRAELARVEHDVRELTEATREASLLPPSLETMDAQCLRDWITLRAQQAETALAAIEGRPA